MIGRNVYQHVPTYFVALSELRKLGLALVKISLGCRRHIKHLLHICWTVYRGARIFCSLQLELS